MNYHLRHSVNMTELEPFTQAEKDKLKHWKMQELAKYKQQAMKMFNSEKNQSQMLSAKTNDIRNEIMQKFKYEQIKRRNLREFIRKAKDEIMTKRGGSLGGRAGDTDKNTTAMLQEMGQQAKTTEEKEKVRKMKEEHKAQ